MNNIPSETFGQSYCIFVHDETYKNHLPDGVKLLKANFKDDLYCIVIPNSLDFKAIESDLFKLPQHKKGFWGQYGMGYSNKTWTVV
jgi:hypothetical protein